MLNRKNEAIIAVTQEKYKYFLANDCIDGHTLYCYLIHLTLIQKTNKVWATDIYLRQIFKWGKARLTKAKKLLLEMGLIKTAKQRDPKGLFDKTFLEVLSGDLRIHLPAGDHNCFNEVKDNIYINTEPETPRKTTDYYHELLIFWNSQPFLITHSADRWNSNMKKRHREIIFSYGTDEVSKGIQIYNEVLSLGEDTYWTKRWPFWEWVTRGFETHFLPEANPDLSMWRKNKKKSLADEIMREG